MTHRGISLIKSGLRLTGYSLIIFNTYSDLIFGVFILLAMAEIFGIVEEFRA